MFVVIVKLKSQSGVCLYYNLRKKSKFHSLLAKAMYLTHVIRGFRANGAQGQITGEFQEKVIKSEK